MSITEILELEKLAYEYEKLAESAEEEANKNLKAADALYRRARNARAELIKAEAKETP